MKEGLMPLLTVIGGVPMGPLGTPGSFYPTDIKTIKIVKVVDDKDIPPYHPRSPCWARGKIVLHRQTNQRKNRRRTPWCQTGIPTGCRPLPETGRQRRSSSSVNLHEAGRFRYARIRKRSIRGSRRSRRPILKLNH